MSNPWDDLGDIDNGGKANVNKKKSSASAKKKAVVDDNSFFKKVNSLFNWLSILLIILFCNSEFISFIFFEYCFIIFI